MERATLAYCVVLRFVIAVQAALPYKDSALAAVSWVKPQGVLRNFNYITTALNVLHAVQ